MSGSDHLARAYQIALEDGRYDPEAFFFVNKAVRRTAELVRAGVISLPCAEGYPRVETEEERERGDFHVHGKELLEGVRIAALEDFGLLAPTVLTRWGVRRGEDVGEIVFAMVEQSGMGKREVDSKDDFRDYLDFGRAFEDIDVFEPAPWDQIDLADIDPEDLLDEGI